MTLQKLLDEIDAKWPLKWQGPHNPYSTESAIFAGRYWYHYLPGNYWMMVNAIDTDKYASAFYKVRIYRINARQEPVELVYCKTDLPYNELVLRCTINDMIEHWYNNRYKGHHNDGTDQRRG